MRITVPVMLALATFASGATVPLDAPAMARRFLDAFAFDPSAAKKFTTKDAVIVVGDIGGTYGDYVPLFKAGAPWLKTCRVAQLQEKPRPTAEEMKDAPPRYQGGEISVLDGAYDCSRPGGANFEYKFNLVLKGDRVVSLALGDGPK